ncbi:MULTISPECIES: hypothetical protein [unclassified Blastococcus]
MSRARARKGPRRGRVVAVVALVAAAAVAGGAVFLTSRWDDDTSESASSTTPPAATSPTAAEETDETDGTGQTVPATDGADDSSSAAPSTPAGPVEVTVVPTYSAWDPIASAFVAGGYVPDVIEDGGTCTLTLSHNGVVLTGESVASADATTTDCAEVRIAAEELAPGPWEAVLGYASAGATGESAPFSVVVP